MSWSEIRGDEKHGGEGVRGSRHGIAREQWLRSAYLYCARGNDLPHARATPELVRRIRENRYGWPRRKWAEVTGLHIRTIDKIATFETWRTVR